MAIKKKQKINTAKELQENRLRYFIQMLDVKQDSNMTRIYTAIKQSDFLNSDKKKQ